LLISSWSVNKHGRHRQFLFLIGWFLKKSSLLKLLGQMNWNLVGSIYWRSSIKKAITGNSCFKSCLLISLSQMNWNLVGSIYRRFCIKFPQSTMKGEWAHWASSYLDFYLAREIKYRQACLSDPLYIMTSFVSQPYLFLHSVFPCIRPLYNDPLSNATNDRVLWVTILHITVTTIRRLLSNRKLDNK
jgi:hypothetical protein